MKIIKLYILLFAVFCTTSLSAQYKLDIVYSTHDRKIISYEPFALPQDQKGNAIIETALSGSFKIPVKIDAEGNIISPEKKGYLKTFEDFISDQVTNFKFAPGTPTEDIIIVNFTSPGDQIENIKFPTTPEPDNLVYFLYLTIFGDTPTTPAKEAITLNATKAVLKAYNQPNALPKGKNNRQNIYDFINKGTLFPFEYLLNSDSQKLLEELVLSNSNPATSHSIELLDEIQRILFHIHNSRVLKLALQDIDKSGYDWQAAMNNKVWGDNPRSLIIPKHKQSWESLMEFITETLPSNPEAVVVEKVLKSFIDRNGAYRYRESGYPESGRLDWDRWIKGSLFYNFEDAFIANTEKYKIVGYPNDSKEEVSELFGCAMLRANLITYKNSKTLLETQILQFTKDWDSFDITVRQESKAVYKSHNGYDAPIFCNDFSKALMESKKFAKFLKNSNLDITIEFKVNEYGHIADIDIVTPLTLTQKEAIICKEEIIKTIQSLPNWTPAYCDHTPISSMYVLNSGKHTKKYLEFILQNKDYLIPTFQGRDIRAFHEWVVSALDISRLDIHNNIRVTIRFVVDKDGSLSNIEILQASDSLFSEEIIRVMKTAPKWTPGKHNNEPVQTEYTMYINSHLSN